MFDCFIIAGHFLLAIRSEPTLAATMNVRRERERENSLHAPDCIGCFSTEEFLANRHTAVLTENFSAIGNADASWRL